MVPVITILQKGLTAIELLIIASVVAIVAVFATPMISNAVLPSVFKEGIKMTESSVEQARQTARFYNTEVLMRVGDENAPDRQVITLVIPEMQKAKAMSEVTVKFILPAGVRVVSQEQVIHFKPNGEVEQPSETLTIFDQVHNESRKLALIE
jgi:Tfp pilus assembly protein FimT